MESSASSSISSSASSPSSSPPHPHGPSRLTISQQEQLRVEEMVSEIYQLLSGVSPHARSLMLELWRDKHVAFLTRGLRQLGPSYHVLDANRPWLCYWILHSIALLGELIDLELEDNVVDFLSRCEDKDGGYGGGPGQVTPMLFIESQVPDFNIISAWPYWTLQVGWDRIVTNGPDTTSYLATYSLLQMPHLATTYAAVNTLVTLGSERALASINRNKMYKFLLRMKDTSGAFRMHDAGEVDVRACYTAISVASILNILEYELVKDVGNYILRCQTYEGGIAGEPGSEAHGGYTFCGLATMILINEADMLDLHNLIDWVAFRQAVECGFQGRTNKLVDGCYSFWQGGALALMQRILTIVDKRSEAPLGCGGQFSRASTCRSKSSDLAGDRPGLDGNLLRVDETSFESEGKLSDFGFAFMKRHTEWGPLFHSIALQQYILLGSQVLEGGFKDKPGKHRDHYHSCYCLSGLSVSQYSCVKDGGAPPLPSAVLGSYANLLEPIHPLYNVVLEQYYKAHEFFSRS